MEFKKSESAKRQVRAGDQRCVFWLSYDGKGQKYQRLHRKVHDSQLYPGRTNIGIQHLKIQKQEVSRDILKELHKLDDKILGKRVITLSSSGDNTSIDLSRIPIINDDDDDYVEDAWV